MGELKQAQARRADTGTEWSRVTGSSARPRLDLPIIFLTGHPDIPSTVRTIKAGADDFLTKPVSSKELLHAVERAIAHHEVSHRLNGKLETFRAHLSTLTPREREVFELVTRGNTNKQIARALGCAERTIKAHRQRTMEKLEVRSLAELVSLAERVGVLGDAMSEMGATKSQ